MTESSRVRMEKERDEKRRREAVKRQDENLKRKNETTEKGAPSRQRSVSYTHLLYSKQRSIGNVENFFHGVPSYTLNPVSYTHLDVYKRQCIWFKYGTK